MGTKQDCENGDHTVDNQGLCWWCGCMMNRDWNDQYYSGEQPLEKQPGKKKRKSLKKQRPTGR